MTAVEESLAPRLGEFPEHWRRIALTLSCRDTDALPKVTDAGQMRSVGDVVAQVMHNGVVIEKDSYCGPWMTEIIRCLRGHHEPQEELVFSRILERLEATDDDPTMIELGSWWAYYSLWLLNQVPQARVIAVEPDPEFLEIGRRNFALNGRSAVFVHGGIGPAPGQPLQFLAESDGELHEVPQYTLSSLMVETGVENAAIVLADIQGAETAMVQGALDVIAAGRVRFFIISTHHHGISGDALTHQRLLETLVDAGAHIIAEHSVSESFSGDGLIAGSFDSRDRDLEVQISHARARDSLFGELEHDLDAALHQVSATSHALAEKTREIEELNRALAVARDDAQGQRRLLAAIRARPPRRWGRGAQALLRRLRRVAAR